MTESLTPPSAPTPSETDGPTTDGPTGDGPVDDGPVDDEAPRRRGTGRSARRGGVGAWLRETAIVVVCALVLSVLIKTFLVQAFYIPSGSMEETLEVGDRVMVSKLTPGPFDLERGDIVVFLDPGGWLEEEPEQSTNPVRRAVTDSLTFVGILPQDAGQHLIKRAVGLPGDTVTCCDADGRLMVNGEPVDEPYLAPGANPSSLEFEVVVPEGHLWVMGDNRDNSADSRAHMGGPGGGFIPIDNVVGTAFATVWPLSNVTWHSDPEETFEDVPAP
ncbi:signal peptidase I [Georgenia sp. Z1491]|uniref:signal peptidase I n=1 Tax=Georgenia sp. Z1491 TaxID=3416707 RepID=UPI003CF45019